MTNRRQRGGKASSQPQWMRVVALLCVLLVAAVGTAQAAHIHGELLPKVGAKVSQPASVAQGQGEEHCPLCVAMHTAMPAGLQVVSAPVLEMALRLAGDVLEGQQRQRSFALFSRPPPVEIDTPEAAG